MNDKTKRALKGFAGLNDAEKREFLREIDKYKNGGFAREKFIREVKSFSLGPKINPCDCCGR